MTSRRPSFALSLARWATALAILPALGGADDCGGGGSEATCRVGNKTYTAGDEFPASDGCNTCACL